MAVLTVSPTQSGDDGYVYSTTFNNSGDDLRWGSAAGLATPIHSFIRFPNVTIPKGATINDVEIWRRAKFSSSSNDVDIALYFEASDNAVAPTSASEFSSLSLTSGLGVGPLPAETADEEGYLYRDLGDGYLAEILQGVINRDGWESGNAIMLVIKDDSSTSHAYRSAYSADYGEASYPMEITIDYTASVSTPVIGQKYPLPAFKKNV